MYSELLRQQQQRQLEAALEQTYRPRPCSAPEKEDDDACR